MLHSLKEHSLLIVYFVFPFCVLFLVLAVFIYIILLYFLETVKTNKHTGAHLSSLVQAVWCLLGQIPRECLELSLGLSFTSVFCDLAVQELTECPHGCTLDARDKSSPISILFSDLAVQVMTECSDGCTHVADTFGPYKHARSRQKVMGEASSNKP